jgi:hypothetical protein
MMANASRDPYWQASVRGEVLRHPAIAEIIQDKCTTCHTPMARFTAIQDGEAAGLMLDDGFSDAEHPLHTFAMDGVSCTVCHQITQHNLGEAESFSGGYQIDSSLPMGRRPAFGPYQMETSLAIVMRNSSGFVPVQSMHVEQSELCATCHTLYTPFIDDEGEIAGVFPEQTVYLEWLHSDYGESVSCQGCHMPRATGGAYLSPNIPGGELRYPIFQHSFIGGNAYVTQILDTFADELNITATVEQFDQKIVEITEQLATMTAAVNVEDVSLTDDSLRAVVSVESRVGHKFPSAFPSRRAWLHFTVTDAGGRMVFESGAFRPDGFVEGNDNDASPALYEPHYERITSPDQVQIYESIMHDVNGDVTSVLLRGAGYVKDNRLLPAGFDHGAATDARVVGLAVQDANFMETGSDRIVYEIDVGEAAGPYTVSVELLYQSIAYRWAQNLARYQNDPDGALEVRRFLEFYDAVENVPVVVAKATVTAGE